MRAFRIDLVTVGWLALSSLAGLGFGVVIDLMFLGSLRSLAQTRGWRAAQVSLRGLGRIPLVWFALAGASFYAHSETLSARAELVVSRALLVAYGVSATVAATRIAVGLVRAYAVSAEGPLPSTSIFVNLTRIATVLLGSLIILNALGISIAPVVTALGVGGLAVALALQDTLSNLFAGLQIVASKKIRPGDYVVLDSGHEGVVEDIAWRYTTLATPAGSLVIVPNAKLGQAIVTNQSLPASPLSVVVEFSVDHGSDLDRVETIASQVASEVMGELEPTLDDYQPIVRFRGLSDGQVTVAAVLRAHDVPSQHVVRSAFIKRVYERLTSEGIPFASRVLRLPPSGGS